MMKNSHLNNIVEGFIKVVEDFKSKKILQDDDLRNHSESNLHSWLQYALIKSGEKNGLFSVPEVKLRFSKPIDPLEYGIKKERRRHFNRVDVAFYDEVRDLVGVSEIYTLDEAHGSLPSRDMVGVGWLTPRDSLLHMIRFGLPSPKFIILVNILLKKAPKVFWPTNIQEIDSKLQRSKNYYDVLKEYWIELKRKIEIPNCLLIISEDGIERI